MRPNGGRGSRGGRFTTRGGGIAQSVRANVSTGVRGRESLSARGRVIPPAVRANGGRTDTNRTTEAHLGSLPKVLSAFSNGWAETTERTRYRVVMKDEYTNLEKEYVMSDMTFKWLHEFLH